MKFRFVVFLLLMLFSRRLHAQNGDEWYLYTPDKFNLYMYEFGKGDTVIVLHGGFGAEYSYLLKALQPLENQFHFVLFDQRGSLRSPAPDSVLSFEKLVSDIDVIRNELHLNKITLLAHSMGTRVAMAYAVEHPEAVRNLILVSSFQPLPENSALGTYANYYLENRNEVQNERDKLKFPSNKSLWTDKMYSFNWRISFASVNIYQVDKWREMQGGVAFFNQHTANVIYPTAPVQWNYNLILKQAGYPITVINGDYDFKNFTAMSFRELLDFYAAKNKTTVDSIVQKENQTMADFIKHASWIDYENQLPTLKVEIIPKAGHRPWIDQPAAFNKFLLTALQRKI